MDLQNKTILITGASSGIGHAIAEKLASTECRLILTARRINLLEELNNLPNKKALIEIFKCDTKDKDEVDSVYKSIIKKCGVIDAAILNAGTAHHLTPETFDSKIADEIIRTNFLGVVYWVENLMRDFISRKSGLIAGVSSLADNRAYGISVYNPSKAALTVFLEGLRLDMKKHGVKILNVRPGFVETDMTVKNNFKMPFLLTPGKAAEKIITGIEKEKKIIQFPWQMVLLTRIIGLLPLTIFEFLFKAGRK